MDWYLVVILGIGATFSVLAILWAILEIFAKLFTEKPKATQEIAASPAAQPTAVANDEDETELVAILAAAIAAYTAQPVNSFRVVSFRQIENRK